MVPGYRIAGLTLIELLLALALSLLLSAAAVTFFVSQKESSVLVDAVSTVQERGLVVLELLSQDLRLAGYQGCLEAGDGVANLRVATLPYGGSRDLALRGFDDSQTSAANWSNGEVVELTELEGVVLAGTDVVMVSYLDPSAVPLHNDSTGHPNDGEWVLQDRPNNRFIQVDTNYSARLPQNSLVMVANCLQSDVFARSNSPTDGPEVAYGPSSGLASYMTAEPAALDANEGPGPTRLGAYASRIYFVGDTGRQGPGGAAITALFRKEVRGLANSQVAEMMAGVTDFQVLYARRNPDDTLQYFTADAVDMRDVVAIRFELTVAADDTSGLSRTFSDTVTLRNRRRL